MDRVDITPQLIREDVQFTSHGRMSFVAGYDEPEVDDFLDRCADRMEEVMRENNALRMALSALGLTAAQLTSIIEGTGSIRDMVRVSPDVADDVGAGFGAVASVPVIAAPAAFSCVECHLENGAHTTDCSKRPIIMGDRYIEYGVDREVTGL